MKFILSICCILGIVILCLTHTASRAQQAQQPSRDTSQQWQSHQMNQPLPGTSDKDLSKDRLEDVRQLYELAKKEAEAKAAQKPPDKK